MLAANPNLQVRPVCAARSTAMLISSPTPSRSSVWNGIGRQDLLFHVGAQELPLGVVAGESENRLRQVIRPEAEELREPGDLVGNEGGARDLDHRAKLVVDRRARLDVDPRGPPL